jgi:hypothetical protein
VGQLGNTHEALSLLVRIIYLLRPVRSPLNLPSQWPLRTLSLYLIRTLRTTAHTAHERGLIKSLCIRHRTEETRSGRGGGSGGGLCSFFQHLFRRFRLTICRQPALSPAVATSVATSVSPCPRRRPNSRVVVLGIRPSLLRLSSSSSSSSSPSSSASLRLTDVLYPKTDAASGCRGGSIWGVCERCCLRSMCVSSVAGVRLRVVRLSCVTSSRLMMFAP